MKRSLIVMAFGIIGFASHALPVWFLKVESGREFLVSDITSIITDSYSSEFHLLLEDGTQAGPYTSASFERKENNSIEENPIDSSPMVAIDGNLVLSGLKHGSTISIFDIEGMRKFERSTTSESIVIPVSTFKAGTYVLTIDSVSYKILIK